MSSTDDERADDELMAELSEVLLVTTEVPGGALESARELFTWRTVDAELASLSFDSLVDGGALTRSDTAGPRLLTFATESLTIEVEVEEDRRGRRLVGRMDPAAPAVLELRTAAGTVDGRADGLGRFVLDLPRAPERVTLLCRPDGGRAVESASVVV